LGHAPGNSTDDTTTVLISFVRDDAPAKPKLAPKAARTPARPVEEDEEEWA
jgi:predicted hydrolase (HD superfamily)